MFQLVEYSELNLNEKYKIVECYEYTGRFEETVRFWADEQCVVVKFNKLYNVTKNKKSPWYIQFSDKTKFYKFVSDKPQEKMERRAVNLIIRKLIGDDHFEWC